MRLRIIVINCPARQMGHYKEQLHICVSCKVVRDSNRGVGGVRKVKTEWVLRKNIIKIYHNGCVL